MDRMIRLVYITLGKLLIRQYMYIYLDLYSTAAICNRLAVVLLSSNILSYFDF